jgi:hypothetical protein
VNFADVMEEVAGRLSLLTGLRVHASPPGSVTPPAAVVSFPGEWLPGESYGRGMATMTVPVVLVVGVPTERQTRDLMAKYLDDTGPLSIVQAFDTGSYVSFDNVKISRIEFDVVPIGSIDYMAAVIELEITGQGK